MSVVAAISRRVPPRESPRFDVFVALVVLVILEVEAQVTTYLEGPRLLNAALLVLVAAPFVWRRRAPLTALAALLAAATLQTALATPIPDLLGGILILVAMSYTVGYERFGRFVIPIALALVVVGVSTVSVAYEGLNAGDVIFPSVLFGALPLTAGRIVRRHADRRRELAWKSMRLEREREERAQLAVEQWRTRIAREVHDVVAHSVSEMVVQAQAGRRLALNDPERARETALEIEDAGRDALYELRRLLGVLRRGDEELALAPQPTLRRLGALVQHARSAGVEVDVRVEGEPFALGKGVDLTAYRVVQDALAGARGEATVVVRYDRDGVLLEVIGAGELRSPSGLQDRVEVYGGELELAGGALRARLPREPAQVPA